LVGRRRRSRAGRPRKSRRKKQLFIAKDGDKNLIVDNFELRFSYKFSGDWAIRRAISQRDKGNFVVHGYQADFEVGPTYSGILYEEGARHLAQRGQKTVVKEVTARPQSRSSARWATRRKSRPPSIRMMERLRRHRKGNHLQHFINGKQPSM